MSGLAGSPAFGSKGVCNSLMRQHHHERTNKTNVATPSTATIETKYSTITYLIGDLYGACRINAPPSAALT